ncbi:septal ring lytic transglycosylase RlpA family protein [Hymenobacter jejuensis]|uniref:Probable endolytic peptidoglycan transglycosylase RlpA n=1 Tax=Hymenobacter jejuensis TaxID=2502781 RepID=A0A5B7ZY22_9BACT|nr:septal ring lytic transglycosylase RlpA family protein [Hymenobacter jejuensis]QDA59850.1 septal ring lytic transglycosylase RlpA family protein [Hymenobacter jejuensis]
MLFTLLLAIPQGASAMRSSEDENATTTSRRIAVMRGRASWYGREHQGQRTSSGERFDRFKYTCAHKTLPFGTHVRVTNPENGKSVVVRVTDRGPFRHARILDLAEVAARPLGIVQQGAVDVVAEVVPNNIPLGPTDAPDDLDVLQDDMNLLATSTTMDVSAADAAVLSEVPKTLDSPAYIVQAGTFSNALNAQAIQAKIQALDNQLVVTISEETINGRALKRVVVGQFADRGAAEAVRRKLQQRGITGLVRQVPLGS